METLSIGFVGGGRIVRIILAAWQKKGFRPKAVVVSDPNPGALNALQHALSGVDHRLIYDNAKAASQEVVFLAVHPPALGEVLPEIAPHLQKDALVISLAPKLRIAAITKLLHGHPRIVRTIPNAASIINQGYNPVAFGAAISHSEKQELLRWFALLGTTPEVDEAKLEAYALITAMGPTYLWFQLDELEALSRSFGLSPADAKEAIGEMIHGTAALLHNAGLAYEEVVDLIPVKPIGEHEAQIRGIYRDKLGVLYTKLK